MSQITARARAEKLHNDFHNRLMHNRRPDIVDMLEEAFISMLDEQVPRCEEHPKYAGKNKPRTSCEQCWRYYLSLKDHKIQGTTKQTITAEAPDTSTEEA